MQASITLGLLLITEIVVSVFGCYHGTKETVVGVLWALAPIIILPVFLPVTAILFLATSCGLNSNGELRTDTLVYKLIKLLHPKISWAREEVHICPTFRSMAWTMTAICGVILIVLATLTASLRVLVDPQTRSIVFTAIFMIASLICYLGVAKSLIASIGRRAANAGKQQCLGMAIFYDILGVSIMIGCFLWLMFFLVAVTSSTASHSVLYSLLLSLFYSVICGVCAFVFIYIPRALHYVCNKIHTLVARSAIPSLVFGWYNKACPIIKVAKQEENKL